MVTQRKPKNVTLEYETHMNLFSYCGSKEHNLKKNHKNVTEWWTIFVLGFEPKTSFPPQCTAF